MKRLKVLAVFGTRPEAIKMAPLVLELKARENIDCLVCLTAQHREMLDSVLDCFGISPDYDLNIMEPRQSLDEITSKVLLGLSTILERERPELVLVHGDTTTALSAALGAFYHKITVGHVEAGLRTFDRYSPYPEEMNRALVARLARLHFAPTTRNAANLRAEGVTEGVFITGNTVIDAMRHTVRGGAQAMRLLPALDYENRRVIAMTCHRRENYGEPMENIFTAVRRIALDFPDVDIVFPVHLSPVVRDCAHRLLSGVSNIYLTEPLDTLEMHWLLSKCYLVLTDSGGLQEEAPALGKPVLVLRRETERPEAVEAGCVVLAGTDTVRIYELTHKLLTDEAMYAEMAKAVNPYGDGFASRRITDAILWHYGYNTDRPQEFTPE